MLSKNLLRNGPSNNFLKRLKRDVFDKDILLSTNHIKSYEEIPGPKPLPILGNLWRHFLGELSSKDVVEVHKILNNKYGDICAFRNQMGMPDMVFIYHPDEIEKMIRNEGPWPQRIGLDSLVHYRNTMRSDIFGKSIGLVNAQGEEWYKLRSKINPILMKPHTVRRYISRMDEVSSDFIQRMKFLAKANTKSEMPEHFYSELCKWSFETISAIALGIRMGVLDNIPNKEAETMVEYLIELSRLLGTLDSSPIGALCITYNLPIWRKFVRYQDYVTNKTIKLMDALVGSIKTEDQQIEECVFKKLLKIDQKIALVMTLDLLSAGVDTTGKFISAILYYLSKNVDVQNKLRQEILENVPSKSTCITNEILLNFPYLRAVMKEAGRLSPVFSMHHRITTSDLVLKGFHIPKGKVVLMSTLYQSNNPKHYIRPKEFIPERWLRTTTGPLSSKNVNTFITIPFGHGPRSCVGRRFANLAIEVLVAKVIRNFELRWEYPEMRFSEEMFYGVKDPLRIQIREYDS